MAKIALISDTHFGVRNDNKVVLENTVKFLENIFFPYIDKLEIKHVIHLGDLFDRRKFINFNTANITTKSLIAPLYIRGIESHFILGNHDVYFKDSNDLNSLEEIYGGSIYLEKMNIYKEPANINIDGLDILLLPWINPTNKDLSLKAIEETKASVVMSHLELTGFEMYRGSICDHGMDKDIFQKFDVVCSGHFHHKSSIGGIHYLGSSGQFTWSDYGDARGFHIFDTETRTLEFIPNHYHLFNKFFYDDKVKTPEQIMKFDPEEYAGSFVKIIVKNKTNPYLLEKVVDAIEKENPADLQIIEEKLQVDLENDEEILDEAEDTLTIIKNYIKLMNYDNKDKLEKFMTELYVESLTFEK